MDRDLRNQLIASAVPSVVVPIIRAGVNNHFMMKQLDRQEEMAVKVAERQANGVHAMTGGRGTATVGPVQRTDPRAMSPGDVYDELEGIKSETDCGFCHNVVDSLMDSPPDEARRGYDELRSYLREVERIEQDGVDTVRAEQIVDDLVEQWTVIPRHLTGVA